MNILYSLYYGYGKTFGANRVTGIIRDAKFAKSKRTHITNFDNINKADFKSLALEYHACNHDAYYIFNSLHLYFLLCCDKL